MVELTDWAGVSMDVRILNEADLFDFLLKNAGNMSHDDVKRLVERKVLDIYTTMGRSGAVQSIPLNFPPLKTVWFTHNTNSYNEKERLFTMNFLFQNPN